MKPSFSILLLKWNRAENRRSMPWKGEKDPYKIWLSEIILQQTRVEQGWAYYERFVKTYPTIKKLAAAKDEEVFKLWEGLGYYSRCKNLLATARIVVNDYKGVFPSEYEQIKALKGIGPYTAAAIISFAFNKPYAVVDGNVQRVLARYFGITTPIDTTSGKKMFDQLAQALLDKKEPSTYNQAIMDFGATICKPQSPLCESCPLVKDCQAYELDCIKSLPVKEKSIVKKERVLLYYILVFNKKFVYIRKRKEKDIWQNLHEFVLQETKLTGKIEDLAVKFLEKQTGKRAFMIKSISPKFKQQLTHQTIIGYFIVAYLDKTLASAGDYELVEKSDLKQLAFPRFINQYFETGPDI